MKFSRRFSHLISNFCNELSTFKIIFNFLAIILKKKLLNFFSAEFYAIYLCISKISELSSFHLVLYSFQFSNCFKRSFIILHVQFSLLKTSPHYPTTPSSNPTRMHFIWILHHFFIFRK